MRDISIVAEKGYDCAVQQIKQVNIARNWSLEKNVRPLQERGSML